MAKIVRVPKVHTYRVDVAVRCRDGRQWEVSQEFEAVDMDELMDGPMFDRIKFPEDLEEFGQSPEFRRLVVGVSFNMTEIN